MRRAAAAVVLAAVVLGLTPGVAAAAGEGSIAGIVTPTAIAPEVEICMVEARPSENCTSAAADGTYVLSGLPTNTPLRIEFIPSYRSRYAVEYYLQAHTLAEASPILAKTSGPLGGVNANLELGAAIEGTVSGPGGAPLAGVEACALEAGRAVSFGCVDTDATGGYALGGLPPGSYKVGFFGRGESAEYAASYYDGATSIGQATPLALAPGDVVTDVDETMQKGAAITGRVVAATTGSPLEGVPVCAFVTAAALPARCAYTGLGGAYSLFGLSAGGYQVGFSLSSAEIGGEAVPSEDDGYLTQFYDGVASRAEARVLTLSLGASASGVDAGLLKPTPPPALVPPAPPASNLVAAPPTIAEPKKPTPMRCKKGFVKKKAKGATKCVKKAKKAKKARKHRKKAKPGRHGESGKPDRKPSGQH